MKSETALNVAGYIITQCLKKDYEIHNQKLNCLLYFSQSWFLLLSKGVTPCFDDSIEAWCFGPVVPLVYNKYARYGSLEIPGPIQYQKLTNKIFTDNLDTVIDYYGNYAGYQLFDIIKHQEPYKKAIIEGREFRGSVISNASITSFFVNE